MNWTDLNKSTQLHDALIGHARQHHDYTPYWLAAAKLGHDTIRDAILTRAEKLTQA